MEPSPRLDPTIGALAADLEQQYAAPAEDPWAGSPFKFLRSLPSRTKGAAGEQFVEKWARSLGFEVERASCSQYDRLIDGVKVEVKMSTLWASGLYKFQQVRDQDYDQMLCLGISPHEVHAWLVPKAVLAEHVIGVLGQHTGSEGSDTAWFSVVPGAEPVWMKPYGATLEAVEALLRQAA